MNDLASTDISRSKKTVKSTGRRAGVFAIVFACGIASGLVINSFLHARTSAGAAFGESSESVAVRPGPWGELRYVPLSIAAPEELLPLRAVQEEGTRWFFRNYSRADLSMIMEISGVPEELREELTGAESTCDVPGGVEMRPSREALLALPAEGRLQLYDHARRFPENRSQIFSTTAAGLEEQLRSAGIAVETIELMERLSCHRGGLVMFSGISCILESLPDEGERIRFVRALTRQKTLLLSLHVTPQTDINALASYWGHGVWAQDVRAFLESVAEIPGGAWVEIDKLLPPMAASRLYSFPMPSDVAADEHHDCHWTSLNFFNDPSELLHLDLADIVSRLRTEYEPATGDPRFGDIVLFTRADGSGLHSAVVLADDIVFTKNGDTPIHPWMLSTIGELSRHYSCFLPEGENLTLVRYRIREDRVAPAPDQPGR